MKVRELKELLAGVDDDMDVLIPLDANSFTGEFLNPCTCETGVAALGIDEDSPETQDSFVIAPHGFFEERVGPPPELN